VADSSLGVNPGGHLHRVTALWHRRAVDDRINLRGSGTVVARVLCARRAKIVRHIDEEGFTHAMRPEHANQTRSSRHPAGLKGQGVTAAFVNSRAVDLTVIWTLITMSIGDDVEIAAAVEKGFRMGALAQPAAVAITIVGFLSHVLQQVPATAS